MENQGVVIVSALRTPFSCFGGTLMDFRGINKATRKKKLAMAILAAKRQKVRLKGGLL